MTQNGTALIVAMAIDAATREATFVSGLRDMNRTLSALVEDLKRRAARQDALPIGDHAELTEEEIELGCIYGDCSEDTRTHLEREFFSALRAR